jgi:signal transduction histidine kinase
LVRGVVLVASIVLVDFTASFTLGSRESLVHSVPIFATDVLTLGALGFVLRAGPKSRERGDWPALIGLTCAALVLALHGTLFFLPGQPGVLVWNVEKHLLSVSLFAFAWAAGERSQNLLGRVFVRLNLTFIILASLIMLITTGMEKYQYLRLAEERSMNLAEFLRGHITYYRSRGDSLEEIIRNPAVLKRVVVEFGTLPELRTVNLYLDGRRASFHYAEDWEIKEEIVALGDGGAIDVEELENGFQMLTLPLEGTGGSAGRIQFLGTTDYINEQIGKYIILIYVLFTVMVGLASGLIGIIVVDTDRRLRRQYDELQETHQQLTQAAKLASVGQLAGGMAHEINTPISHMTDEKNSTGLNPRQRKNLQLITEQAQRISKVVGNLLTFSRQGRLELGQVDVEEVVDSAVTLVQFKLREGRINLRWEIDGELPLVLGDPGRLTEVFVNLFNNAIDAMPGGGTLFIRAFTNGLSEGGVCVEVADTGCGIPPDDVLRIFDPFFTTKEPGRGTGLGLSISHGIVKDHGGRIWASSQPGVGTTLVVALPKEAN